MKHYFRKNWESLFGGNVPDSFDILPLTTSRNTFGNDLILLFSDGAKSPDYVFKICRDARCNVKLKREYHALSVLSKDDYLKQYIPAIVCCGDMGGRTFVIQKGIRGIPLARTIQKKGITKSVNRAIEKSILLLGRINSIRSVNALQYSGITEEKLENHEFFFSRGGLTRGDIQELFKIAKEYSRQNEHHQMMVHGDYWPHNIFVDQTGEDIAGIIDWEFACMSPICSDICWFIVNIAFATRQHSQANCSLAEAFHYLISNESKETKTIVNYYHQYISNLNTRYYIIDLLKVTLAKFSIREQIVYGQHGSVDTECMSMLKYLYQHEADVARFFSLV